MKEIALHEETQQLVKTLAALANPARFRILEILARQPRTIVADIVDQLPIAQATVSQHLSVLRDAGLIFGERDGSGQCCRVNFETVSQFAQDIAAWTLRLAVLGIQDGTDGKSCKP
ncbi:ArsR/SmtB family transcription factor [Candidatus Bipolaricaulota bacterium]